MSPSEIIDKAIGLLQKGWCTHATFTDTNGVGTPSAKEANSYCMLGAIYASIDPDCNFEKSDQKEPLINDECFKQIMLAVGKITGNSDLDQARYSVFKANDKMTNSTEAIAFLQEIKEQL